MNNLPLFKKTFEYASAVIDLLEGMPKKYRFCIGESMLKSALNMFRSISYANRMRNDERVHHIDEFLAEYDISVALIRFANEKKILSIKQIAHLTELTHSIARQAKGWRNS